MVGSPCNLMKSHPVPQKGYNGQLQTPSAGGQITNDKGPLGSCMLEALKCIQTSCLNFVTVQNQLHRDLNFE